MNPGALPRSKHVALECGNPSLQGCWGAYLAPKVLGMSRPCRMRALHGLEFFAWAHAL